MGTLGIAVLSDFHRASPYGGLRTRRDTIAVILTCTRWLLRDNEVWVPLAADPQGRWIRSPRTRARRRLLEYHLIGHEAD